MIKQEIEEKVIEMIRFKLCLDESQITTRQTGLDYLGMDSLDQVELTMEVEDEFNIAIDDDEYDGIETIGDIVKLVEVKCE